jgi:hypothetical protein
MCHPCTTPAEPSRNCVSCNGSTDDVGPLCPIEGPYHGVCGDCYADIRADEDYAAEDPDIDGDYHTGYEADDERPYGWDVPEEEYPDW